MKLSSRFAGMALGGYEATVTWRDTMNYAAAVGDRDPRYFDDEAQAGIIAPPMYSVAFTWPISERLPQYIKDADFPLAVLQRQVHYMEDLEFARPIVPGERLHIEGRLAAISPHPAGTSLTIRYDARDPQGGPVFTEHITGLLRGVACEGEARGLESLPVRRKSAGQGDVLWSSRVEIDPLCPFIYDGCTRIHFPIHTSKKFAHGVGLPDIILQGTATLAFAVREITQREAAPEKVRAITCRFNSMVFPGDSISVQLLGQETQDNERHLYFRVLDDRGKFPIQDGYVRALL